MRGRTFTVMGPFCGTCLAELLEQVRVLRGVSDAAAALDVDGTAVMVLGGRAGVHADHVRVAVERAGFALSDSRGEGGPSGRRPTARARALLADMKKGWG